jgi:hypothetical protein
LAVTVTAVPTVLQPVPVQVVGAVAWGPKTLKLTNPPGAGEVVAPARVPDGVTAVLATTLAVAPTLRVGSACTTTVVDLALSVPVQLDEAMVGTSVYCQVPAPGVSVQVTTEAAMLQLPLMGVLEPEPWA